MLRPNYTHHINMPVLRIPELVYTRLQAISVPLEDTPVSVIERLLSQYESQYRAPITLQDDTSYLSIDPYEPPSLTHTRVVKAIINSKRISTPNWNKITNLAHELAVENGVSPELLHRCSKSKTSTKNINERGFKYLEKANISVQGVDANLAWRNAFHLLKDIAISVEVDFEWHEREEAAYPGRKGRFIWNKG